MKKYKLFTALLLLAAVYGYPQASAHRILLDITSKDTADHHTLVRHASGTSKAYPDSRLEVVIYGGAINMVLKDKTVVGDDIQKLTSQKNVEIVVCAQTMKRYNVDKSHLVPGVKVVPDALIEIVAKQKEGWGYIKEAN